MSHFHSHVCVGCRQRVNCRVPGCQQPTMVPRCRLCPARKRRTKKPARRVAR